MLEVEEDGDSDDERQPSGRGDPSQHVQRSQLSTQVSVGIAADPIKIITVNLSTNIAPPEVDVHRPDRKSQTTNGKADYGSELEHVGHSLSGAGGVIPSITPGPKSKGREKNIRMSGLWSKLRSIAYITGMQVRNRLHQTGCYSVVVQIHEGCTPACRKMDTLFVPRERGAVWRWHGTRVHEWSFELVLLCAMTSSMGCLAALCCVGRLHRR